MNTETTLRSRSYTDEDAQAVCDLLNLCDAVDKLDDNYSVDDLRREFEDPQLDKHKDMRLWHSSEGILVGFGQIWVRTQNDEAEGGTYIRIHPEYRQHNLETEVLAWAEGRLREAQGQSGNRLVLRLWMPDTYKYMRDIADNNGFKTERYFFEMIRPLNEAIEEPKFPEGYTLRHITAGDPAERWVDMFNMSFIDHWNHHPMTVEEHKHTLASPKYVPERDLVAVAPDGEFAAFCFCLIDPEDNKRNNRSEGWIDILGTRRGHRKIGLGKAMLLSGLLRLKADGMETAKLGVDAENPTGALRLYESVGFRVRTTSISTSKELAAAG